MFRLHQHLHLREYAFMHSCRSCLVWFCIFIGGLVSNGLSPGTSVYVGFVTCRSSFRPVKNVYLGSIGLSRS